MLLFVLFSIQFYQTVSGGTIKETINPKFTWISPTILDVSFPDGWQDQIKLKTTSSIPGVYDPCLFTGKFLRETNASITVSGCHNDANVEITIFSSHLQGRHMFRITDGVVVNLNENITGYTDDGVVVPGDKTKIYLKFPENASQNTNDGVATEKKHRDRFRRELVTVTNYVDDFLTPPQDDAPTLAGGAGGGTGGSQKIPSKVTINMKLGYEDSFLNKMGSNKAAVEYINKVVTHGKSYFLIPSLKTKLYIKFPEIPVHYPGHQWQPDINLHEARQYQKDSSVPHTFFCHKENTYYDGMAYVGGACRRDGALWGVAMEKWSSNLVYAAETFAHETGHLFGMNHDFIKRGSTYDNYPSRPDSNGNQCKNTGLMSYGDPLRVTEWSTCSLEDFKAWFNDRGFTCLKEADDEEDYYFDTEDVSPTPDDTVEIVSKGDGGVHQEKRMGFYTKTNQVAQGYPVYEKKIKKQFLFVGPNGSWRVGPDITTYSGSGLKNPQGSSTVPRSGWQYRHRNEWIEDESMKVKDLDDTVEIISTGEGGVHQEKRMGIYIKTNQMTQGYPVYEKNIKKQFLFVGPNGSWRVGPDITTYSGSALKNSQRSPIPPRNGWQYRHSNKWIEDTSMTVKGSNMQVSSSGGASSALGTAMGLYRLQPYKQNGFAVWKKDKGDQYLFVTNNKFWGIGADLNSIIVSLYLDADTHPEVPETESGNWWFYDNGWKQDQTLSIEEQLAPEYVKISSKGEASRAQKNALGVYSLETYEHNNYPVWKQAQGDLYLFVTNNGYWGVGKDITTITVLLYLNKETTPEFPEPGDWWYYDNEWKKDQTIGVVYNN